LFSTQEKDYQIVKEEIENLSITNKILNKSNLELKQHIRSIEEERENEKEIRYKLIQANKVIEELKNNIITLQRANQEMNERLENLKKNSSDLVSENKKSFSEIENLNKNFELLDKNNFELKNQIESLEEINKRQETEKFNLITQLNEKEKTISELHEKIRCLNELNSTTRKSCRDYEDMLKGMKRTIDIMKKSNDDSDAEMMRVKISLDEAKENLVKKNDEYECLEKIKTSLQNEIEMLKNEILFLANENNNKDKNINDSSSNMRNIFAENERLKLKLDNFNKIIEEKDISIENMKISVLSLNRNLEESKTEIDSLKRRLNDEMIEKNKLSRNRDQHDYHFSEYKKQIDELTRLKDNLYKQNFALEEDNVENRNKYYQIRNENEQLNMKINFLNETIKELQMDLLKANSNKNNTDQEKDNLNLKITDMQSQLNQAKSSEFSLKNDIDNLNSKILSKERTIESLLRSKDELNNEIFNLKEKLTISANEKLKIIEDYDNNYNEIQLNEIKSRKELEKISNELRSKDNFIENLQKTIHEINNRLNDFSTQREKERVIFEKNIEDLKKRLMESVEREKILHIEKEDCSNDLKYRLKFTESLENRLNELGESVMNMKKSNDKLNIENLEFVEKIEEFKQINNDLQEKLEKANQKNDLLSIHLEELKNIQQEILSKNSSLQKEFVYYKNINEKLESKINYLENNNTFNITRNKPEMIFSSASYNNTGSNNIYKRI
jgi:chromosome segregation ATPase